MTLAAETREAVRRRPFLYDALRAGVVNYSATARYLDVDGEPDAIGAALRRFAADLSDAGAAGEEGTDADGSAVTPRFDAGVGGARGVRVTIESGFGPGDPDEALLVVGDTALVPGAGSLTAVAARGDVDPRALERVLGRLRTADIAVEAVAAARGTVIVVLDRRAGPDALRTIEDTLEG